MQRSDEEYDENCLVLNFKQSPVWVMVWACVMRGIKGPLVVLEYPGGKGGGMRTQITTFLKSSKLTSNPFTAVWRKNSLELSLNKTAHLVTLQEGKGLAH